MATTNQMQIVIDAQYRGKAAVQQATQDVKKLDDSTGNMGRTAPRNWGAIASSVGAVSIAFGAAYMAGKQLYGVVKEGASLDLARSRFDNLSASINTTGDALLGKLREATHGMVADADLVASATDMMNLGFAKTEEQAVRLTSVAGQLGWNMQQLTLTLANQSTMRLDALGLSVEGVTGRFEELKKSGMAANEAFQLAVIEAGEAKIGVLGSTAETAAGSLAMAEAAAKNLKDSLLLSAVATLEQVGAFDALKNAASDLQSFSQFTQQLDQLQKSGDITVQQAQELTFIMKKAGAEAAEAQLQYMMMNNTLSDTKAWQGYAIAAAISAEQTRDTAAAMVEVIPVAQTLMGVLPAVFGPAISAADIFLYKLGQVNAQMSQIDPGVRARGDMRNGYGGLPYVREGYLPSGWESNYTDGLANIGYSAGAAAPQINELAAAQARVVSAFNQEIGQDDAAGIIGEDGLVNLENVNAALYDQAEAAGASAMQLAMLGIATGKFTEKQAEAALKAAIFQEALNRMAQNIVSGDMSIGDAMGQVGALQMQLDASQGLDQLQGVISGIKNSEAVMGVEFDPDSVAAWREYNRIDGSVAHVKVVYDVQSPPPAPGDDPPPPKIDSDGDGYPDDEDEWPNNPNRHASGGYVTRGRPYVVGEAGPELFVPDAGGNIIPNYKISNGTSDGKPGYSVVFNFNGPVTGAEDVKRAAEKAVKTLMNEYILVGGRA